MNVHTCEQAAGPERVRRHLVAWEERQEIRVPFAQQRG